MNKEQFLDIMEQQLLRLPKADRDDILNDYEAHFALGNENGQTEEEICEQLGDPAELSATYLENLPENAKGAPYAAPVEEPAGETAAEAPAPESAEETANPAAENIYSEDNRPPVYTVPDYGAPVQETISTPVYGDAAYRSASEGTAPATNAAAGTAAADNSGMIALVVILSLFVALPAAGTIISIWFGLCGTVIGLASGGIASLVAGFAAALANIPLCIGLCLLGLALFMLSGLLITGLIAAAKGIIWLIKWYIGICKKLINGGTL